MQKFYEDAFGWEIQNMGEQMGGYRLVNTGEDKPGEQWPGINGGITPRSGELPAALQPTNAFVCTISVEDIDSMLQKIKEAGGTVAMEKMDVSGVGLLAYCMDPEHNIFGVLQPK